MLKKAALSSKNLGNDVDAKENRTKISENIAIADIIGVERRKEKNE